MKKFLAIVFALAAVTTMSGCKWWPFGGGAAKKADASAEAK